MTSKEALREIITATLKYLPDSVIEKNSKLSNIVLQDLERLEALEKENQELQAKVYELDTLKLAIQNGLLNATIKENEKLKKQIGGD